MEMLVDADAQVVRHVLADAFGEIVVDIARDRADHGDDDGQHAGEKRDPQRVPPEPVLMRPFEGLRELVGAERVVQHELQRPRRGKAHQRLDQHRREHDCEPLAVGADELAHERHHRALRPADLR